MRTAFAFGTWLIAGLAFFLYSTSPAEQTRIDFSPEKVGFVRNVLQTQHASNDTPTVYWPAHNSITWIGLSANSYYNFAQIQGVAFSPKTAREARQRIELVRPFEVAYLRSKSPLEGIWPRQLQLLQTHLKHPQPTRRDLLTLARDERLDWIVLPYDIGNLASKIDGSLYVYNCHTLRSMHRHEISLK